MHKLLSTLAFASAIQVEPPKNVTTSKKFNILDADNTKSTHSHEHSSHEKFKVK
jgi:hypothetical protein